MVEIQLIAREAPATVLAGILIARKNVETAEPHLASRNPIIRNEQNDARHPDGTPDKTNGLIVDGCRQRTPTLIVKRAILLVDRFRNA